jgi:nitroreductase
MIIDRVDHETVRGAIALATRAPSIHNSQPWQWQITEDTVHLYADMSRWLPATDADGRDLVLSCGAALHHLRAALAAAGVRTSVQRLPDNAAQEHLAAVQMHPGYTSDADLALASRIPQRRTDRRPFGNWPVPAAFLQLLARTAEDQGAILRVIDDDWVRGKLIAAIRQAAAAQAEMPDYRAELAAWTGRRTGNSGVPAANLPSEPSTRVETTREFVPGDLQIAAGHESDRAVLAVLGTASDDTLSRLRAGEALSAVLLEATALGLASCPLSQPLEIGSTKRTLRDRVLDGTLSPQLVLRLGWPPVGPPLPVTPRRAYQEQER